jgi:tetrapyrrole methylase family protein/MazG family protein
MLQIVFHAKIASSFSIDDVISGVCKKMISRHPHVFGTTRADTANDVLVNWEEIKRNEKGLTNRASALKQVPANLPALIRAYKVQQKARDAGFDWDDPQPVMDKVEEEFTELRSAIASGDGAAVFDEFGDMLFALVNLSRFIKVFPEFALTAAVGKFTERFEAMEKMAADAGRSLDGMSLAEMDVYWEQAKKALNAAYAAGAFEQGDHSCARHFNDAVRREQVEQLPDAFGRIDDLSRNG